jgi:hypothetical protein
MQGQHWIAAELLLSAAGEVLTSQSHLQTCSCMPVLTFERLLWWT